MALYEMSMNMTLLLESGASLGNVFHGVLCHPMLRENQLVTSHVVAAAEYPSM